MLFIFLSLISANHCFIHIIDIGRILFLVLGDDFVHRSMNRCVKISFVLLRIDLLVLDIIPDVFCELRIEIIAQCFLASDILSIYIPGFPLLIKNLLDFFFHACKDILVSSHVLEIHSKRQNHAAQKPAPECIAF